MTAVHLWGWRCRCGRRGSELVGAEPSQRYKWHRARAGHGIDPAGFVRWIEPSLTLTYGPDGRRSPLPDQPSSLT